MQNTYTPCNAMDSYAIAGNGLANNGGLKMQSAVDLRNLAWLEFAARSVDKPNLVSSSNPSLFSTLATKLAAQSPYECSLANISVEVSLFLTDPIYFMISCSALLQA